MCVSSLEKQQANEDMLWIDRRIDTFAMASQLYDVNDTVKCSMMEY
jgi:hypothetical protein